MLLNLPWIIVSFLFYNGYVFSLSYSGEENIAQALREPLFSLPMISGASWPVSMGDVILITAMVALFVEILKATQTRSLAILDHGLSVIVFIICVIEFLTVKQAATSIFFFITFLSLIDVIGGFSVGIRAARRDFNVPSAG